MGDTDDPDDVMETSLTIDYDKQWLNCVSKCLVYRCNAGFSSRIVHRQPCRKSFGEEETTSYKHSSKTKSKFELVEYFEELYWQGPLQDTHACKFNRREKNKNCKKKSGKIIVSYAMCTLEVAKFTLSS